MKPTESDFLRDLAADLKYVSTYGMVQGSHIGDRMDWLMARLRAAEGGEG